MSPTYNPYSPLPSPPPLPQIPDHLRYDPPPKPQPRPSRRDRRLKFVNRALRFILRSAGLPLALYTTTVISIALHKYATTVHVLRGSPPRSPWPHEPSLWSAILLLALSAVSLVLSMSTLLAYALRGVAAANKVASVSTQVHIWAMFGQLVSWGILSVIYRLARSGSERNGDPWGWSCSSTAKEIQPDFFGVIDLGWVCGKLSSCWYATIIGACVHSLWVIVWIVEYRRRKIRRHARRESLERLLDINDDEENLPPNQREAQESWYGWPSSRESSSHGSMGQDEIKGSFEEREYKKDKERKSGSRDSWGSSSTGYTGVGSMDEEKEGRALDEKTKLNRQGTTAGQKAKAVWGKFLLAASL